MARKIKAKNFKAFCANGHEKLVFDGNPEDYLMHMKHEHQRIPSHLTPGRGRAPWRGGPPRDGGGREPSRSAPGMAGGKILQPTVYKHI